MGLKESLSLNTVFVVVVVVVVVAPDLHCCARAFSSCGEQGLLSSWGAQASHCGGFSCCRAWALGHAGFSSCGSWLWSTGSTVVAQRLSCSSACAIFQMRD